MLLGYALRTDLCARPVARIRLPGLSFTLFAVCLSLCGCMPLKGLKQTTQSIQYYVLEYPRPSPVVGSPSAGVLRLKRFQVASVYATDRLVVAEETHRADYYYFHRWAVTPSGMVTDLILRDLTASGLFRAALTNPGRVVPDFEMSGTLDNLGARKEDGRWMAESGMTVIVYPSAAEEGPDRLRIFQKRYQAALPCADNQAPTIVETLSRCLQQMSSEFITDFRSYLAEEAL